MKTKIFPIIKKICYDPKETSTTRSEHTKKALCFLTLLMLTTLPVYGENAMDYFNLCLKSAITPTKIKYFSKALELDPMLAKAFEN